MQANIYIEKKNDKYYDEKRKSIFLRRFNMDQGKGEKIERIVIIAFISLVVLLGL